MDKKVLAKIEKAYNLLVEVEEELRANVEDEDSQLALAKMSRLSFVQSSLILLKRSVLGLTVLVRLDFPS